MRDVYFGIFCFYTKLSTLQECIHFCMDSSYTVSINHITAFVSTMHASLIEPLYPPAIIRLSRTTVAPTARRSQVLLKASEMALCHKILIHMKSGSSHSLPFYLKLNNYNYTCLFHSVAFLSFFVNKSLLYRNLSFDFSSDFSPIPDTCPKSSTV